MLPNNYTSVREHIIAIASIARSRANNELNTAVARHIGEIDRTNELAMTRLAELDRLTVDYMATGIARLPDNDYLYHSLHMHGIGWGHMSFSWWRYFKDMAKELRRPLVTVNVNNRVSVQKFAYTRPLVAQFLLVPNVARPFQMNKKHWWFGLYGTDEALTGEVLLQHWLKTCAEDPEMRRALRLP